MMRIGKIVENVTKQAESRIKMIHKKNKSKEPVFEISAQNEKESWKMLQMVRPKEGELRVEDEYAYDGNKILYISDLHLDHFVKSAKCKTREDVYTVLQNIGRKLQASYREYVGYLINDVIVLINGDITHSPELFKMFTEMDYPFLKKTLIILGNHELWAYPGLSVDEIVNKYSALTNIPIVQNEIILYKDIVRDENSSGDAIYTQFDVSRLPYDTVMNLSVDDLSKGMLSARAIILAGIGFSGCNDVFNANIGLYGFTITREQEIAESKKFEAMYNHFVSASRSVKGRVLAVASHMPLENWSSNSVYEDGIVYISGHTHRNYFYDDGSRRIYADNQNGYYGRNPLFKCVYTDDLYDPFISYADGIYKITKYDYLLFYRAKKKRMDLKRDYKAFYMLKKNGYYCFLARLNTGKLSILNGGRGKSLEVKDEKYYYERMDKIINRLAGPLEKYTLLQKEVAKAVRSFGGSGYIHGCIVDIDFYNHIFINPVDQTITGYYALDMVNKWVYDSIPAMLEEHSPALFAKYQRVFKSESENALINTVSDQTPVNRSGMEYLETDIYKASREICRMQKMEDSILSFWDERLLDEKDRYIKPTKKKIPEHKYSMIAKLMPINNPPSPKVEKRKIGKDRYMGMTRTMNCGLKATVIGYIDHKNLIIQFEDGVIKRGVRGDFFMEGRVSHTVRDEKS